MGVTTAVPAEHRRPPPPRDPTTSRLTTRAFVRGLVMILATASTLIGVTYIIGPTPTAPSLVAMAGVWPLSELGGMRAWGALLAAAGLAIALRWYTIGHGVAALVLIVWAGCSTVTIIAGTAPAASGPATLGGLAAIHGWCLYARRASRWSP